MKGREGTRNISIARRDGFKYFLNINILLCRHHRFVESKFGNFTSSTYMRIKMFQTTKFSIKTIDCTVICLSICNKKYCLEQNNSIHLITVLYQSEKRGGSPFQDLLHIQNKSKIPCLRAKALFFGGRKEEGKKDWSEQRLLINKDFDQLQRIPTFSDSQ